MGKLSIDLDKSQNNYVKNIKSNTTSKESYLLLSEPKEDLSILSKIGLDHKLELDCKIASEINAIEHFNNTIGKTYSGQNIKKLSYKFDLKIDRAVNFKSGINTEVVKEINAFCEKNNVIPVYNSFYVFGPAEYFEKPLNVSENCILFYKDSYSHISRAREDDRFTEICSWGGNYSFFRRFRFLFYRDFENCDFPNIILTCVSLLLFIVGFITGFNHINGGIVITIFAGIILLLNGFIKKEKEEWN